MRYKTFIFLLVFTLSGNFLKAQISSYLRYSVGTNFLSDNEPSHRAVMPSSINWFPSLGLETSLFVIEREYSDLSMHSGLRLLFTGFGKDYAQDSIIDYKAIGLGVGLGFQYLSYHIEKLPIGLELDFHLRFGNMDREYVNKSLYNTDLLDDILNFLVTPRLDFFVLNRLKFRMSIFTLMDFYLKKTIFYDDTFRFRTFTLGLSFGFTRG